MAFFLKHKVQKEDSFEQRKLNGIEQTLDRLYKIRDLEISNLWQRSVFLAVFLTLTLGAYGALISKDMGILSNIGCVALAIIGLVFSLIWIMMGKGSKAWYEVYENAITQYEEDYWRQLSMPYSPKDKNDTNYRMGKMPPPTINNNLKSTEAGAYSPSRLNIIIGHVFWIVWVFVYITHTSILTFLILQNKNICDNTYMLGFVSFLCSLSIFLINWIIKEQIKKYARSGFLNGE